MTGIELIAAERERQVTTEGWTPEHDDLHTAGEIPQAAQFYVDAAEWKRCGYVITGSAPAGWPWSREWWKPSPDPIRNLVKAGALIAAEIDRLQRAALAKEPANEA